MIGADLVRLALAAGDRGRVAEVVAAVDQVAARNAVASLAGAALRCRGLARGDAETLLAAVDVYAASPRPLELALTCEEAAAVLARRGHHERARGLLKQAAPSASGWAPPAISPARTRPCAAWASAAAGTVPAGDRPAAGAASP